MTAKTKRDAQFVTLGIEREVFAVPVDAVVEILDMRTVFRLPEAPAYLAGLIDVRGRSIPVIDLRVKLGLPPIEPTENTRILVLEIGVSNRDLALGLIADRVFEVMTLDLDQVEPAPDIGIRWRSDYISGVARWNGDFVIIMNLPMLFSNDDVALIGSRETAGLTKATHYKTSATPVLLSS